MAINFRRTRKENNPRNKESQLFKMLTRLLSGPVVNRHAQTPRRERRRHLDKYKFTSASGQQFKKAHYSPYEVMQAQFMATQNRMDRYVDFDQMEYTPEINSALDIYADEMTTSTAINPLLTIKCSNEEIKNVLDGLYHNILNVEFNLFGWCRTMCKYGDFFLYLDLDEKDGIKHVVGLPTNEVERLEGEDKENPNYVQFQWNSAGMTFENWQISHFRILGNDKFAPYGTSILDPARRIWRQLTLLEDAMMAYRIVRSPERRVFYVDVGNVAPQDVEQYMQKVMTQMKRNQIVDVDTGRVDLRYNPLSTEEDYFIPTRGEVHSRVESLPGGTYTGDIDDVKYLRDKLFAALKIPASYLSRAEGAEEDKTTLAQKDIRFARTIQRLQRSILPELEKIGIIHLFTMGYRSEDLVKFTLSLNNPSKIASLQELEQWRTKFEVAGSATEGYFSKRWVSENLFNLSEEEFLRMQREMFYDKKVEASLEQVAEEAAAASEGGGALGGGGMEDMEGMEGGGEEGMDDLGGMEGAEGGDEAADETPGSDEGGEEGVLLAAPGEDAPAKRDDKKRRRRKKRVDPRETTTPSSKGKRHLPAKYKGGDKRPRAAAARSWVDKELSSPSMRNVFPGYQDLRSVRLYESRESNYDKQEDRIIEMNSEIKSLIEDLEKNKELLENETETQ
mgnify:CR=1 FL=1